MKKKIYFRADGNSSIGLGHVIRSLALADMLKEDFECHFIIRTPLDTLKIQILEVCESIIELQDCKIDKQEAVSIAEKYLTGGEIVVLDGYHFRTSYQQIIRNKKCKVACIDDIFDCHYVTDLIINHAGGISSNQYSAESYTTFCLGLSYALLRKPFLIAAKNRQIITKRENVLICLGGADPKNDTLVVLKKCLEKGRHLNYYVIIGGAYLYKKELESFIQQSSISITLLSNLNANEMVAKMKECTVAITSPSTISYEYLSVGGELYLYVIADNQININDYFLNAKLAFSFDDFLDIPSQEVQNAQKKQAQLLAGDTDILLRSVFNNL